MESVTDTTNDMQKLIEILIKKKNQGSNEYHFRPYLIDGVYCYIVLYLKFSILTVESVNVKCKYTYLGKSYNQPYVLYYRKYKSFKDVLNTIKKIASKYKILNGDLESPENYNELKLESCILPYNENERCCVCFENTTDTTLCDHYICFKCRDKCIIKKQYNCPICRSENALTFYNNTMQLFNNRDSSSLHCIFIHNPYKYSFYQHEDENEESSSDEEEESSSEEENEDEEEDNRMDVEEQVPIIGYVIDRNPSVPDFRINIIEENN
jgi:hypothetical protein